MMLRDPKEGTEYDLCQECKDEFDKFLIKGLPIDELSAVVGEGDAGGPEKPKRGRPRKDGSD